MPVFYLAWVTEGTAFNAATHATPVTKVWDGIEGDEEVFTLEISHTEGEFPSLLAELRNPRVGLLSAGRNQWIWLSADDGLGAVPLFTGRIVGVPEDLTGEVVRVEFLARPPDYIAQKAALADSLRVLPWFDRLWLQDSVDDPDTVLEAYPLRYHINRTTLLVTVSDIIAGEDGTIEIGESDHFYDGIRVTYGETPLRRVEIDATVTWRQAGSGEIELNRPLAQGFQAAGSPYPEPMIASLTGQGLLDDWPAPLADIGGGWSIAPSSTIELATWIQEKAYVVRYGDRNESMETPFGNAVLSGTYELTPSTLIFGIPSSPIVENLPGVSPTATQARLDAAEDPFGNWEAAFNLTVLKANLVVRWDADRGRTEILRTTVEADVQPLLVDPGADETETIEVTSDLVAEPIDPDLGSPGAFDLPIGDARRNSYFKTDRGQQSFEYLLLVARAKLLTRSRAVEITVSVLWSLVAEIISCRKNIHLVDYRLPGGEATGKVTRYVLRADEDEIQGEITLSCTIGYGVPIGAPAVGTPDYVEDGYVDDYQTRTGAEVSLIAGELNYQSFDEFEIYDDDGVDLLNMTATTAVNSLTVTGGPAAQRAVIDAEAAKPPTAAPTPVEALEATPTVVTLDLVPVDGGDFLVEFNPTTSLLVIPQTIDLEAAA